MTTARAVLLSIGLGLLPVALGGCLGDEPPSDPRLLDGAQGVARVNTPNGVTELSYVVQRGHAIHAHDIDLGPIEDIVLLRGGAVDAGMLWTNGLVYYAFDDEFAQGTCDGTTDDPDCVCDGSTCTNARDAFRAMVEEIDALLPLSITEVSPSFGGDFILVEYESAPDEGWAGHSPVGMQGGEQNLTFNTPDLDAASDQPQQRTAQHEFLHALGMWHEQSRTDRDSFIIVNDSCYQSVFENDYAIEDTSADYGPYDFVSIMHYQGGLNGGCIPTPDGWPDPDMDGCICPPMVKVDPVEPDDSDAQDFGRDALSVEDVNTLTSYYADALAVNEIRDRFGQALAIGDFDADGYDDLAVGAPGEDYPATDSGAVFIYKGTSRGLVAWRVISHASYSAPATGGESLGSALAVGRFDSDEFVDLAIGIPSQSVGGIAAGSVVVFRGGRTGLTFLREITQTSPWVYTNNAGERFGAVLAAGDLAAQGYDALVVGAPADRNVSGNPVGAVYTFQFSPDGTAMFKPTRFSFSTTNAQQGGSLAIGRFNGDANADLAVGMPGNSNNTGAVMLLAGRTPPETNPLLWSSMVTATSTSLGTAGSRYGSAIAFGDLTFGNISKPELVVGAPGFNSNRGKVVVLEVATDGSTTPFTEWVDGTAPTGAFFGISLAIGNVDDITIANDLVIGEPNKGGGRIIVIRGGTGVATSFDQPGLGLDDDAGDTFGQAVAVGQLDGWGWIDDVDDKLTGLVPRRIDLVVGAPGEAPDFIFPPAPEDPTAGAFFWFRGRSSTSMIYDSAYHQEVAGPL